jgi:hypothetical protein
MRMKNLSNKELNRLLMNKKDENLFLKRNIDHSINQIRELSEASSNHLREITSLQKNIHNLTTDKETIEEKNESIENEIEEIEAEIDMRDREGIVINSYAELEEAGQMVFEVY